MKSVALSFVIFGVVYTALSLGVIDLITNDLFTYISRGALVIVLICGVYFVGLPKRNTNTSESTPEEKQIPDMTEQKAIENHAEQEKENDYEK